jgi:glycosyltransferase involved in cell wall biosynthesis
MSKIKNIAHFSVHGYFDPEPILGRTDTGGQVTYVLELAKCLAQINDIKVDIYTRQFEGRETIAPVNDRVRVVRLPCGSDKFIRKEDIFPHWDEFVDNTQKFFQENGLSYEVLHGHYWDAGYVCMNLGERLNQPFFYTAHSLGAWKREQMGGDPEEMEKLWKFEERVRWENILFRKAVAHTVTTEDGKDIYKRLYDFETPDMDIIPPGVDIHRFRPLDAGEKERELDTPEKYVFCLSRIDSNKGHAELIRAFAHVVKEVPDAYLVIGGGSKEPKQHELNVRAEFTKIVDELNLRRRPGDVLSESAAVRAAVEVRAVRHDHTGGDELRHAGSGHQVRRDPQESPARARLAHGRPDERTGIRRCDRADTHGRGALEQVDRKRAHDDPRAVLVGGDRGHDARVLRTLRLVSRPGRSQRAFDAISAGAYNFRSQRRGL